MKNDTVLWHVGVEVDISPFDVEDAKPNLQPAFDIPYPQS
jgi:hypothetical protein